ncbi:hypothetical protein KM043_003840 [Ampulex compressa]|nr:hypothetical protein KM043_003840 [Ampulex compressa]
MAGQRMKATRLPRTSLESLDDNARRASPFFTSRILGPLDGREEMGEGGKGGKGGKGWGAGPIRTPSFQGRAKERIRGSISRGRPAASRGSFLPRVPRMAPCNLLALHRRVRGRAGNGRRIAHGRDVRLAETLPNVLEASAFFGPSPRLLVPEAGARALDSSRDPGSKRGRVLNGSLSSSPFTPSSQSPLRFARRVWMHASRSIPATARCVKSPAKLCHFRRLDASLERPRKSEPLFGRENRSEKARSGEPTTRKIRITVANLIKGPSSGRKADRRGRILISQSKRGQRDRSVENSYL